MRTKVLFVLLLLLALGSGVQAQGGTLNYGDTIVASVSAQAPLAFFTFNGVAGDRVTVIAVGISPGLDPAISLNAPTQQQLANNDNDPTSPGTTDARVTVTLAQTGVHTILVNSVSGTPGDFLIRLFGQPAVAATDVSGAPADVTLSGATQVFSVNANPTAPVTVNVSTVTPGFGFSARIYDPGGQPVAALVGSDIAPVSLNIPPGTGAYSVEVTATTPNVAGQVMVSTGAMAGQPAVTPAATEQGAVTDEVCNIGAQTSASVNIRSGPGIDFSVLTSLDAGERFVVTGVFNTWFRVDVPGIGPAWARRDVVTTFGPCDVVPVLDAADVPVLPPTTTSTPTTAQQPVQEVATFTPTTAPQQPVQATPTYTPTAAPPQATPTYTPSYTPTTPPAAQVAPDDARFNNPLEIPLDSTASVTDFVSYPGGDREDRVRWDITGMNSTASMSGGQARLTIAVSCFGDNTDQIQFFTNGQTFGCGQTIVDRDVTFDSKTGQVTITAVGGEGTYVQWVLTGTATRTN